MGFIIGNEGEIIAYRDEKDSTSPQVEIEGSSGDQHCSRKIPPPDQRTHGPRSTNCEGYSTRLVLRTSKSPANLSAARA